MNSADATVIAEESTSAYGRCRDIAATRQGRMQHCTVEELAFRSHLPLLPVSPTHDCLVSPCLGCDICFEQSL